MHIPHPTLDLPLDTSHQKTLGVISFALFYYKAETKGGGAQHKVPSNTLLPRSLILVACE